MNISIETGAFFPDIKAEFGLFHANEPVWTTLDRLREFITGSITPNLPGDRIIPGMPLKRHVAMISGEWTTENFDVVCNAETGGKFQVMKSGRLLVDAILLCAGSLFASLEVELGKGVIIEPGVLVKGPVIVGDGTEIRQGAYVRGDCLFGKRCVVGHTTEVKHSIFLDSAKAGHFAYIGDSILGRDVNMGAGTKLANLRFGSGNVWLHVNGRRLDTGRRKIGAVLGDGVQTGCNSVTNPGSIIGPGSLVAPNTTVAPGVYGARAILR